MEEEAGPSGLVSSKDLRIEDFLNDIFDSLPTPRHASAVELARLWKEEVQKKIATQSVVLSHRTLPLVQIMLDQKVKSVLDQTFVKVKGSEPDMKTMVNNYSICFNQWIDSLDYVSFKAANTQLLGNLTAQDVWTLTFFAFCTNHRTKNDNLLQLGLVGCSTSGKSTLFESILMEGAHLTTNEGGVGRFHVGSKPVLLFHDIAIKTLVKGKDVEKIKTIARTEPTVAKVHSKTEPLPPLFIFYSSNERLMTHEFNSDQSNPMFRWRNYGTQAIDHVGEKRVKKASVHLVAIQNRFIEAFVRSRPPLDPQHLPQCGGFQRIHGVLGLFRRVLNILGKYEGKDFHSPFLYLYALKALCKHSKTYVEVMDDKNIQNDILIQVFKLVHSDQIDDIIKDM